MKDEIYKLTTPKGETSSEKEEKPVKKTTKKQVK